MHVPVKTVIHAEQCDTECCCAAAGCIAHVLLLQVSDAVSAVFGGTSFDVSHLTTREVSAIVTGIGGGLRSCVHRECLVAM